MTELLELRPDFRLKPCGEQMGVRNDELDHGM